MIPNMQPPLSAGGMQRMTNPYHGRPDYTFWRQGVSDNAVSGVDPVVRAPFAIGGDDLIATAGSCFAQHISRTLIQRGLQYLVTETFSPHCGVEDENYGVFPARFGNIYTARQLLQLFDRAYGVFFPQADYWTGYKGAVIDPFRPRIQTKGFATIDHLQADRVRHLSAVRRMFEECDVFIFTLGLTETWISTKDGAVFPLAPGAVSPDVADRDCRFHNFTTSEVLGDMTDFIDRLASVNPAARIILTVSPVPLIATYEDRHVLVSTIASKSILRAAVEDIMRQQPNVSYFPSYEIVTGPQAGGRFYAPDLREVTAEGVSYVMSLFSRHYLEAGDALDRSPAGKLAPDDERRMAELAAIVCDERAILP
jgi:hypothetical protein